MDRAMLLADRNSNAWSFAGKIKDYIENEKRTPIFLGEVSINYFRNKEIEMYVPENVRQKDVYFIQILQKILKIGG